MPYVIRHEDREWFKRCRRAWDFGHRERQGLEPIAQPTLDIQRAILDALEVYYFPDMWDWDADIVLPLVLEGFVRSMRKQRGAGKEPAAEEDRTWSERVDLGRRMLERYFEWALTVDRFSPARVETELEVDIPDPEGPELGLFTSDGAPIRYKTRADLLVVDEDDRYWIVRQWAAEDPCGDIERAFLDDEAISNCWAWEFACIGIEVEGTVHNELRAAVPPGTERRPEPEPVRATETSRLHDRGIAQHEPSGGGRSIPQYRRMYAHARKDASPGRVEQQGIGSSAGRRSRGRAKSWRASERGSRGRRWTWSGRA